jgi:hypothetical protein
MTVHGCMVIFSILVDDKLTKVVRYIDVIVDNDNTQDCAMTVSILDVLLKELKHLKPDAKMVVAQSDNGAHYSGSTLVRWVHETNKSSDLPIRNWVFSESQRGKTSLDAHNSYISFLIEQHVNQGCCTSK